MNDAPPSASAIAVAAGCINSEWNGALTGSCTTRRKPSSWAIAIAACTPAREPDSTTWPGALSLAICTAPLASAFSTTRSANSISAPIKAAIAPSPTGTAACIASPLIRSNLAPVDMSKTPTAERAEYSPSEWPATKSPNSASDLPLCSLIAATTASELANKAGCAFAVSVNSSAGPSAIRADSFCPRASSTCASTSRAAFDADANETAIPGACDP